MPFLILGVRRFETFLPLVKLHIIHAGISPTPFGIHCLMPIVYLPLEVCQTLYYGCSQLIFLFQILNHPFIFLSATMQLHPQAPYGSCHIWGNLLISLLIEFCFSILNLNISPHTIYLKLVGFLSIIHALNILGADLLGRTKTNFSIYTMIAKMC